MIEDELTALADRTASDVAADLPDLVLARIAEDPRPGWVATHPRRLVAAGVAALAGLSLLVPQVRAAAVDVLGIAGIELRAETAGPDAPLEPDAPLPDAREASLAAAQAEVDFTIAVPADLGTPEHVTVADDGRVVSMTWRGGRVLLDQFEGSLGPVFSKQVAVRSAEELDVNGSPAWWIDAPHDLTYLDRDGVEVTETARLAGSTLVWDGGTGVTYRLEGVTDVTEAAEIARSVR